jgi:hypothetical protein
MKKGLLLFCGCLTHVTDRCFPPNNQPQEHWTDIQGFVLGVDVQVCELPVQVTHTLT